MYNIYLYVYIYIFICYTYINICITYISVINITYIYNINICYTYIYIYTVKHIFMYLRWLRDHCERRYQSSVPWHVIATSLLSCQSDSKAEESKKQDGQTIKVRYRNASLFCLAMVKTCFGWSIVCVAARAISNSVIAVYINGWLSIFPQRFIVIGSGGHYPTELWW